MGLIQSQTGQPADHRGSEALSGIEPEARALQARRCTSYTKALSSSSRTRTYDLRINNPTLYRLSYRGELTGGLEPPTRCLQDSRATSCATPARGSRGTRTHNTQIKNLVLYQLS